MASDTAVVLCPGPSLASVSPDQSCALVVAVNSAVDRIACDVWCCLDIEAVAMYRPDRWDGLLVTGAHAARRMELDEPSWSVERIEPTVRRLRWRGLPFARYSHTAAIVWAAHQPGIRRVMVFGADMAGDADCHGRSWPNRSAERWAAERRIRSAVDAKLAESDIEVTNGPA